MSSTPPTVAIINTSDDLIALLAELVRLEGYRAVTAYIREFREGTRDLSAFLAEHDPRVILWDIAIPYAQNWAYFRHAEQLEAARGRAFVLTTTNKRVLEELVGPTETFELMGKPFDLDEVMQAVARGLERSAGGDP